MWIKISGGRRDMGESGAIVSAAIDGTIRDFADHCAGARVRRSIGWSLPAKKVEFFGSSSSLSSDKDVFEILRCLYNMVVGVQEVETCHDQPRAVRGWRDSFVTNYISLMISPQNIPTNAHAQSPERRYSFEELMQITDLPPPGPDHYAARRALWLNPPSPPLRREPQPFSSSRQRLENMLLQPGALTDDDTWKHGIEKVWKVLSAGGKFKRRLPMRIVVRSNHSTVVLFISLHNTVLDHDNTCSLASR